MQTDKPLVDIDFGLSQLGGNQELLHKMLIKFKAEFEDVPAQVIDQINAGELEEPKLKVHTAKGITGNLGLSALFECCKELDAQIKSEDVKADTLEAFSVIMSATCDAISDSSFETKAAAEPVHIDNAAAQLKALLNRHEFIDDTLLRDLVSSCSLSANEQEQIIDLIEKLQYEQALSMLK